MRLMNATVTDSHAPDRPNPRKAAVLLPLLQVDGTWHLLFTHRTETVQDHKGQVSFPGGGIEASDKSPLYAALRETYEEIGIHREDVVVLGKLAEMVTVSNYLITPVVGHIPWPYSLKLNTDEVSRAFTIPVDFLADTSHRQEKSIVLRGRQQNGILFFDLYDGELLWGISARITLDFLKVIGLVK